MGLSRKHLLSSVDASLRRMGTDYIDLFVVHAFDPGTPIKETMEALHDIVRSGKVRYLGASTMFAWQFEQMNHVARLNGWTPFVNMQCQYNLLYREEEREMIPYCNRPGNCRYRFQPLGQGLAVGEQEGPLANRHIIYSIPRRCTGPRNHRQGRGHRDRTRRKYG